MGHPQDDAFRAALAAAQRIIVLSGAGLSVASGISSFRGASADPDVNFELHTAEAFATAPGAVWEYHQRMRATAYDATPNAAHKAIAALTSLPAVRARVAPHASAPPLHVTQNIDGLALRALAALPSSQRDSADAVEDKDKEEGREGSVIEMHGSIFATRCTSCRHVHLDLGARAPCAALAALRTNSADDIPAGDLPRCGGAAWAGSNRYARCGAPLRPDVVWFGEIPPQLGEIARRMNWCDLLIVVGTSFSVQPAAGFAKQVKGRGGKVAIFNAEASPGDALADFLFLGKCEELLPRALGVEDDIANIDWDSSRT